MKFRGIVLSLIVIMFMLSGCDGITIIIGEKSDEPATPQVTSEPSEAPTLEITPEPTLEATEEPTNTPISIPSLPVEDLGAAYYTDAYEQIQYINSHLGSDLPQVEERLAYIVGESMEMDGQTSIEFEYVEWLSGQEAIDAYLLDYPESEPEDYEFIEQIGYIRNVGEPTEWISTCEESRYFLNRPLLTSSIGEVDYDEFRDWLFTTSERFVIVCTVDNLIARVEWIYMP